MTISLLSSGDLLEQGTCWYIDVLVEHDHEFSEIADWLKTNVAGNCSVMSAPCRTIDYCAFRYYFAETRDIVLFKLFFS